MNPVTVVAILIGYLASEVPAVREDPAHETWRTSVRRLTQIVGDVAQQGKLVGPTVDEALLHAMLYRESRHRIEGPDGDCHVMADEKTVICSAKGPMQIVSTNRHIIPKWTETREDPILAVLLAPTGKISVTNLYEPELNVRLGYAILRHWKAECGGTPGTWMTAYRRGKCPRKGEVDREAKQRCELANNILSQAGIELAWSCEKEIK